MTTHTTARLGVGDSEADETIAGVRAREVPGWFAVDNEIVVERPSPKTTWTPAIALRQQCRP
jgi:hypothetical protein